MNGHCATVLLAVLSCVPIDGGAIEIGWVVRDANGRALSCGEAKLETVRIVMTPVAGGASKSESFRCAEGRGSTAFDLKEGSYLFSLEVLGTDGDVLGPANGVCVPSALSHEVQTGEVTDLAVWLIRVVSAEDEC